MDLLKAAVVVNVVCIVLVFFTALALAFQNSESRNLGLAVSALLGAILAFGTQLLFELKPSVARDWVNIEFTIDRAAPPSIRQWRYNPNPAIIGDRVTTEVYAGQWLGQNNPSAFNQDREKLTNDFAIFSLIAFMARIEFDWQLKDLRFIGKSVGTVGFVHPLSKENECSSFTELDLRKRLQAVGNVFANAPFFDSRQRICLPPKTTLTVNSDSVVIHNATCEMKWKLQPSNSVTFMRPGSGGEVPQLPLGGEQFETRILGWDIETAFFALRSQSTTARRYHEWVSRFIENAHSWFEN